MRALCLERLIVFLCTADHHLFFAPSCRPPAPNFPEQHCPRVALPPCLYRPAHLCPCCGTCTGSPLLCRLQRNPTLARLSRLHLAAACATTPPSTGAFFVQCYTNRIATGAILATFPHLSIPCDRRQRHCATARRGAVAGAAMPAAQLGSCSRHELLKCHQPPCSRLPPVGLALGAGRPLRAAQAVGAAGQVGPNRGGARDWQRHSSAVVSTNPLRRARGQGLAGQGRASWLVWVPAGVLLTAEGLRTSVAEAGSWSRPARTRSAALLPAPAKGGERKPWWHSCALPLGGTDSQRLIQAHPC